MISLLSCLLLQVYEVEIVGALYPEHPEETILQAPAIILQGQIEDRALADGASPQGAARADVAGNLGHEEGLPKKIKQKNSGPS